MKLPVSPPAPTHSGVDLLSEHGPGGWRGVLLGMGRARAVLLITAGSLAMSLLITAAINLAMGESERLATDLLVAALVPLLVAPLASGAALGLLAEVDEARRSLREVAIRDGLTQLHNRCFFSARLQVEVERAHREHAPLTIILLDIDRFKDINDVFGHATGDEVLRRVASALKAHLRPCDLAARFGGEEFVALLPGLTSVDGLAIADRIRSTIEEHRLPVQFDSRSPRVTASIGIASLACAQDCADELVRRADHAMYEAKNGGRNRCVVRPAELIAEQLNGGS